MTGSPSSVPGVGLYAAFRRTVAQATHWAAEGDTFIAILAGLKGTYWKGERALGVICNAMEQARGTSSKLQISLSADFLTQV